MILPGAPRLSQINWSQAQLADLLAMWQDIARVVNVNSQGGVPSDAPVETTPVAAVPADGDITTP